MSRDHLWSPGSLRERMFLPFAPQSTYRRPSHPSCRHTDQALTRRSTTSPKPHNLFTHTVVNLDTSDHDMPESSPRELLNTRVHPAQEADFSLLLPFTPTSLLPVELVNSFEFAPQHLFVFCALSQPLLSTPRPGPPYTSCPVVWHHPILAFLSH